MKSDLETLLSQADPFPPGSLGDPARSPAGEALLARITAMPTTAPRRTVHRRCTWGLATVGTAAALAVTAPLALEVVLGPSSASPAAAAVLTRAAGVATAEQEARPGQYWRIVSRSTSTAAAVLADGRTPGVVWEERRTTWLPVDGSGPAWSDTTGSVLRPLDGLSREEADRLFPAVREVRRTAPVTDAQAGWGTPNAHWLAGLPRDPEQLRARLYADSAGGGHSADGEALTYVADVLRSGQVPADLRAALYRVLTTVGGVEVTAEHLTVLGRPGIALGRLETFDGQRQEIIIDPATGEFVGEREVVTDGLTTERTVRRTLVDAVPADVKAQATAP